MASVRRKGKGWEVRYYGLDALGRPARRSKMVRGTKREAEAQGVLLEGGLTKARQSAGRTLGQAALAWVAKGGQRSSAVSQRNAAWRVNNLIIPAIGSVLLEAVTPQVIEGFYFDLSHRLGWGSIRNVHFDLSGTFKMALRYGWVDENPMAVVERKPYSPPKIVPPRPADIEHMLEVVDKAGQELMTAAELALGMRLALATGARIGEIAGLRWGDIDLEAGTVSIRMPKTGTQRRIAVDEVVLGRLRDHRERAVARRYKVGDSDPLMPGRGEGPLSAHTLGQRFTTYRRQAKVSFRFHDLRHFVASAWLEDMGTVEASAMIGHSRVSTTTDIYGHVIDRRANDPRPAAAIAKRVRL